MNENQLKVWNSICHFLQELNDKSQFKELAETAGDILTKIENSNDLDKNVRMVKDFLNDISDRVYFGGYYEEVTASNICLRDLEKVNL